MWPSGALIPGMIAQNIKCFSDKLHGIFVGFANSDQVHSWIGYIQAWHEKYDPLVSLARAIKKLRNFL